MKVAYASDFRAFALMQPGDVFEWGGDICIKVEGASKCVNVKNGAMYSPDPAERFRLYPNAECILVPEAAVAHVDSPRK